MSETNERPNVVLICVDQWRGDCLSIAGHPVVHTPYLDELCLGGVRFSHAYAAVPSCIAARASLLTGLSQRTHGRVGYRDGVPWNYPVTIAGEFTRQGYQTQAIGKMHVYPERSQMGFQNVVLHDGYLHFARDRRRDQESVDDYLPWLRERAGHDADYFDHGMSCNAYTARPWDKEEALHPTNFVTTQCIDFLRRRDPRKPFFLFMSYHRPHPPLDPPAWAFEQYLNAEMPEPPVGDWAEYFAPIHKPFDPDLTAGKMDGRWLRRARAGYYGHMTHIDQQIFRFLEVLREYQLARNTWVCFVSDHGDLMGDHHLFRKTLPYEGSARVPLILAGPPAPGSTVRPGTVCSAPVELRDIMPTLLECAGLECDARVEGRSFLGLARGEAQAAADWRPYVHGEHTFGNVGRDGGQLVHYLTDGREKYVWFSGDGHEQLFDLENDPQELHDRARDAGAQQSLSQWRSRLIKELTGREEGFVDGERLVAGRPVDAVLKQLRP